MTIETKIVDMTPAMAKRMLMINTCNRPFCPNNRDRIVRDINLGQWEFNGDAIRISETDVLLDGQHRLHAIVTTGKTVKVLIVSGLPDKVFDIIDQNMPRKLSDMLARNGVKYYVTAAATVPLILCYEKKKVPKNASGIATTSKRSLVAAYDRRSTGIDTSVKFVMDNSDTIVRRLLSLTWISFAHYCFSIVDESDADLFIAAFCSGDTSYGVPVAINVRKQILSNQLDEKHAKAPPLARCAWLFVAWNAFRTGNKIKQFRWRTNPDGSMTFPRAQ